MAFHHDFFRQTRLCIQECLPALLGLRCAARPLYQKLTSHGDGNFGCDRGLAGPFPPPSPDQTRVFQGFTDVVLQLTDGWGRPGPWQCFNSIWRQHIVPSNQRGPSRKSCLRDAIFRAGSSCVPAHYFFIAAGREVGRGVLPISAWIGRERGPECGETLNREVWVW